MMRIRCNDFLKLFVLIVCLNSIGGCSKSGNTVVVTPCDPSTSFAITILPILNTNCNTSGCHDNIVITSLNNFQTVHDGATQIKNAIVSGRMPKNASLSAKDKDAINCWIDNGSKNN